MVNTWEKGKLKERRCVEDLRKKGYITWKTIRTKYRNVDIFETFDVVALHPDGKNLLFIQVKSNRCTKKERDKIVAMKMPKGCIKGIWIWKDRKGWTKEWYPGDVIPFVS